MRSYSNGLIGDPKTLIVEDENSDPDFFIVFSVGLERRSKQVGITKNRRVVGVVGGSIGKNGGAKDKGKANEKGNDKNDDNQKRFFHWLILMNLSKSYKL